MLKEKMGGPGLHLMICLRLHIPFRQETSATECVWVLVQFLQADPDLAITSSILIFGSLFDGRERARPFLESSPLLRECAPFERVRPFWEGAPLLEGHVQLWLMVRKGAPLLEGCVQNVTFENLTYWFSIQYPDGVVQVVSTKSVAMSNTGCRLEIWSSQIFFYRQPTRQASTECPLPALKQLNFSMQISSQLSRFLNSNNDHCDLGFSLTVCDILGWPCWGQEAALEEEEGEEGYVVPPGLGVRREDESAVGAGRRRRSQAMWCWGGKFSWSVEMAGSYCLLLTWLAGGSRPYCLLDWQGACAPCCEVWWFFSSFLLQLRVDEK